MTSRQDIINSLSRRELTQALADRLFVDMENEMDNEGDCMSNVDIYGFCDVLDEVTEELTDHIKEMLRDYEPMED